MEIEKAASKLQVFISYSHNDADWARSFAEALTKRGLDVWFDQFRVRAGESLRDALESGLRSSDVFVTLIDPKFPSKPTSSSNSGQRSAWGRE